MLEFDLLYEMESKASNQAVKRNICVFLKILVAINNFRMELCVVTNCYRMTSEKKQVSHTLCFYRAVCFNVKFGCKIGKSSISQ